MPFPPLQETGLGMPLSLSPTPALVPTLLVLARTAVSLEKGRAVISAPVPPVLCDPKDIRVQALSLSLSHLRVILCFTSTHTQTHS